MTEKPEVPLQKEREELVRPMGAGGGAGVGGGELTSQSSLAQEKPEAGATGGGACETGNHTARYL